MSPRISSICWVAAGVGERRALRAQSARCAARRDLDRRQFRLEAGEQGMRSIRRHPLRSAMTRARIQRRDESALVVRSRARGCAFSMHEESPRLRIVPAAARAHHRRQRQRDEPETMHGAGQRQRKFARNSAVLPGAKATGAYTAASVERHGDDGKADLARALMAARTGFMPSSIWRWIFSEHDDGIVHHKTDRQHHREQCQRVDAESRSAEHQRERSDQRQIGMVRSGMIVARNVTAGRRRSR